MILLAYLNLQFLRFVFARCNKQNHLHGNKTTETRTFLFFSYFDKQSWGSAVHKHFPKPIS